MGADENRAERATHGTTLSGAPRPGACHPLRHQIALSWSSAPIIDRERHHLHISNQFKFAQASHQPSSDHFLQTFNDAGPAPGLCDARPAQPQQVAAPILKRPAASHAGSTACRQQRVQQQRHTAARSSLRPRERAEGQRLGEPTAFLSIIISSSSIASPLLRISRGSRAPAIAAPAGPSRPAPPRSSSRPRLQQQRGRRPPRRTGRRAVS